MYLMYVYHFVINVYNAYNNRHTHTHRNLMILNIIYFTANLKLNYN